MIAKLKGIIDSLTLDALVIDVGGVGYQVFCSASTLRQLPGEGEVASIYIETHVREDHIHLYGFASIAEKAAFLTLTKVNGVGAKMALAILSTLSAQQLSVAIAAQDKSAFTQISGVGPKLAARLLTELKDKFSFADDNTPQAAISSVDAPENGASDVSDAVSALVNLGYSRSDSYSVVAKIAAENDNMDVGGLIREGLKILGSS